MPLSLSAGIAVHQQVPSRSDVVLLSDDDDDVENVAHPDHPGVHGKRKKHDRQGVYNKKRPKVMGRSSEQSGIDIHDNKTPVSRSQISTSERMSNSQRGKDSLGEDCGIKSGTVHGSFVDQSVHLADGGRAQLSEVCVELNAGEESAMLSSTSHDVKLKGNQPDTSGVSLSVSSMTKNPVDGSDAEHAAVDEGLLSVALYKHQVALAWMVKREHEEFPTGGILADDQGLGKTISTISLILKERAPREKPPDEAVACSHPGALTVELLDDDDCDAEGQTHAVPSSVTEKKECNVSPLTPSSVSGLQKAQECVKVASSKCRPAAGTLIVSPTSVLRQWAQEFEEKVTESAGLSFLIYHGSNRTRDPDAIAKYDVVLTTYSIVSMEVPKQPLPEEKGNEKKTSGDGDHDFSASSLGGSKAKIPKKATENGKKRRRNGKGRFVERENGSGESGPLARVQWFRVVLDEAQSIKNSRTQVARAVYRLRARRRWCLSGTPIQNSVDDLYSYFRFLGYYPFDSYNKFRQHITDPVTQSPAEGYKQLQYILSKVMIRRTKATQIGGKPIVDLPRRIVTLKQAEFSEEERAFYDELEFECRKQFQDYAAAGTVQHNYVSILWMLLRLRQACDHPLLVKGHKYQGAQKAGFDSAQKLPVKKRRHLLSLLEANGDICSICNDVPEEAVVCICTHVFCRQCISEQLATGDDSCCPLPECRKSLDMSLVFTSDSLKDFESGKLSLISEQPQHEECESTKEINWKSSSKIDAVIDTLRALPPINVVVENGRVVVNATKTLEGEKLLDLCGTKTVNQVPLFAGSHELNIPVKGDQITVAKQTPLSEAIESTQDMTLCVTAVEVGKFEPDEADMASNTETAVEVKSFEPGQADMASNTETLTRYPSVVVKEGKQEADSCDVASMPRTRQIVRSTEKAIVFSQWTSMLDLLEVKLKEAEFNYRRLDGSMSVQARHRAVSDFNTKPAVTVIIMSLKAASLGLNMVAACHVLLLDIWWNPTTEDQAIDRAHRIGQTRTVNVSRFTVKNTIEDRILALQEKKRLVVASAFAGQDVEMQKGRLSSQEMEFLLGV